MSKFCGHCGTTLADNATFCPNCGAPSTDQPAPQFSQPQQFNQPAFGGAPAMGAAKQGMSKNAKLGIIIAAAVVGVGLIVLLCFLIFGGGYEKPLKNYIKSLETGDYELFTESLSSSCLTASLSASSVPSLSSFESRVKNMKSKYGDDFKIDYKIVEKEKVDSSIYLGLIEDGYKLKVEFTISGSKKEANVTKNISVIKTEGKSSLGSAISF